jgi:hypothetical protein
MYRLENNLYNITGIILERTFNSLQGYMTYSYSVSIENDFKEYEDVEIINVPVE